MSLMEWTSSMSVGIEEIDKQHQRLVSIMNDLYAGVMSGKSHEATEKALKDLQLHALEHFTYEEDLMAKAFFPGLAAHKKEHEGFLAKIDSHILDYVKNSSNALSIDLLTLVKKWLTDHMMGTDRKYIVYLRAANAKEESKL